MADSKFVRHVGVCRYALTSLGSLRDRIVRYVGGIRYVPAPLDLTPPPCAGVTQSLPCVKGGGTAQAVTEGLRGTKLRIKSILGEIVLR